MKRGTCYENFSMLTVLTKTLMIRSTCYVNLKMRHSCYDNIIRQSCFFITLTYCFCIFLTNNLIILILNSNFPITYSPSVYLCAIEYKLKYSNIVHSTYQKSSASAGIKPPDLWIHHDQMELKHMDKSLHSSASKSTTSLFMY